MDCEICKRIGIENDAVKVIWEGEVVNSCKTCALREGMPIVKKATQEQVDASNVHYSVRERMERMSNRKPTIIREQAITHKNLARLNFPTVRQNHEDLIENYDWTLRTARRRKKLSIAQLALTSGLIPEDIQKLESGQIVNNLEPIATRLENTLGIVLLKKTSKLAQARYVKKENEMIQGNLTMADDKIIDLPKTEKKSLLKKLFSRKKKEEVKEDTVELKAEDIVPEKKEIFEKIASGKMDFSKRRNVEQITLKDLAEMKKRKEKGEMFGSELEVEED
jgi:ribosome-binding protein aMBF1 (putative translation factor)